MTIHTQPTALDNIKKSLVALKMPRALEMLDATLRRVEQGDITWVDALDHLLLEELTLRDNRHVSTALRMSRLTTVKTLAGFDFAFQPSLDRNRILAWQSSSSLIGPRWCIYLGRQALAKAIWQPRWLLRR
jgi:hypothetical protein